MRYENSFNVFYHYLQYCIYKHYVLKKFTLTWNTKLYKYLICITKVRQRFLYKDHLIGLEQHSKFLTKIFDHLSTLNFCLGLVWNSRTSFPPNYLIISIMVLFVESAEQVSRQNIWLSPTWFQSWLWSESSYKFPPQPGHPHLVKYYSLFHN